MNTKAELCLSMPVQKITTNSGLELNYKREDNFAFHYVDCKCCGKQTLKAASRLRIQELGTTFSFPALALESRLFLSLLFPSGCSPL